MKRKEIERLLNNQDIKVDFNKINQKINYSKYEKEPKKYRQFKFRYVVVGLIALLIATFSFNSIYCSVYNRNLDIKMQEYLKKGERLTKINNKEEYQKIAQEREFLLEEKKKSWLEEINFDGIVKNAPTASTSSSSLNQGATSIDTNTQVEGIDEANVAKCDGTYIYALYPNKLSVFDLDGNMIDSEELNIMRYIKHLYGYPTPDGMYLTGQEEIIYEVDLYSIFEMFVYNENIVVFSPQEAVLFKFENNELKRLESIKYKQYIDSRFKDSSLYLIVNDSFVADEEKYENLYVTEGIKINIKYTIYRYDFDLKELDYVSNLNNNTSKVYMNDNVIALSTYTSYNGYSHCYSFISLFNLELNPIGVVKVEGNVKNQFSMDEYNNYFRVVSTKVTTDKNKNVLSIFSLDNLKRVGFLDKGIGELNHEVKSVAFDKEICNIVTYYQKDPLYLIDMSDVTNPVIKHALQGPGFSTYLKTFEVDGEVYLFGIGEHDIPQVKKISIYKQVNEKHILLEEFLFSKTGNLLNDYVLESEVNISALKHKALFIYQQEDILYLGSKLTSQDYYIFKIDVKNEEVIKVHQIIKSENEFNFSRCFLINGKLYITDLDNVIIEELK